MENRRPKEPKEEDDMRNKIPVTPIAKTAGDFDRIVEMFVARIQGRDAPSSPVSLWEPPKTNWEDA
jgi:hypothetical protein